MDNDTRSQSDTAPNAVSNSVPQSLALTLNQVIDEQVELAAQNGRLFSFSIVTSLPTWVIETDLDALALSLSRALADEAAHTEGAEIQIECRLIDQESLVFTSLDPQFPKDHSRAREIARFTIRAASNREKFKGLLSQTRGSTNLQEIKTLLSGLKFLIVDDSIDNREVACALIEDLGGEVDAAADGAEAVTKALKGAFDCVLMDIQMPVVDGNEAMEMLLRAGYKTPVIAVSAKSSHREREESFKCGFRDYMTKPFQADKLIRTILRLTHRPIPIASKSGSGDSASL